MIDGEHVFPFFLAAGHGPIAPIRGRSAIGVPALSFAENYGESPRQIDDTWRTSVHGGSRSLDGGQSSTMYIGIGTLIVIVILVILLT